MLELPVRPASFTAAASNPAMPPSCSPKADIDGGLIGGAALQATDFLSICAAAG